MLAIPPKPCPNLLYSLQRSNYIVNRTTTTLNRNCKNSKSPVLPSQEISNPVTACQACVVLRCLAKRGVASSGLVMPAVCFLVTPWQVETLPACLAVSSLAKSGHILSCLISSRLPCCAMSGIVQSHSPCLACRILSGEAVPTCPRRAYLASLVGTCRTSHSPAPRCQRCLDPSSHEASCLNSSRLACNA